MLDIAAECLLPEYPRASVATAVLSPSMGYLCLCCERVSAQHGPKPCAGGLDPEMRMLLHPEIHKASLSLLTSEMTGEVERFNLSKTYLWHCLCPAVHVCVYAYR